MTMQSGKDRKTIYSYTVIKRRTSHHGRIGFGCARKMDGCTLKCGLLILLVGPYLWLYTHMTGSAMPQIYLSLPVEKDFAEHFRDLNLTTLSDDRLNHLHRTCKRLGLIGDPVRSSVIHHILVDDKHRTLYCNIPKVACTTWKTVMTNLSANFPEPMPPDGERLPVHSRNYLRNKNIRPLEDYYPGDIRYRLDNYFTFMVVRHPLDRVVSAFRDKMDLNDPQTNDHWMFIQREIIQRYRTGENYTRVKNLTELAYSPIGFQEFVRYALNHFPTDRHWRTFYESCLPCTIRYDKIVKMETMEKDADDVLQIMGIPADQRKIPHFNSNGGERSSEMYKSYLKSLTNKDMGDLLAVYNTDMQLFGYT